MDGGGCLSRTVGALVVLILAFGVAGCGLLAEPEAGLACQEPPTEEEVLSIEPPPVVGTDPDEAAARLAEVGIIPSWRYSYLTDPPGRTLSYSECWCIVPPDGTVRDVIAEPGDQLIVFVQRAEPIPGGRPQPTQGWGCAAEEPVSRESQAEPHPSQ